VRKAVIKKYFDASVTADKEIINAIKTNGITYIAPKTHWKNSMFQSNKMTPTEALLNASKKMTYIDPVYLLVPLIYLTLF
jgi:hypothetical protein